MSSIWWNWDRDSEGNLPKFREIEVNFTIHNNIDDFSNQNGIYLMLGVSEISGVLFYFGLQTDVGAPEPPYLRGKGLIFSRWETRDLANARIANPDEGWTESSGHEGDFIGVRRSYDWGTGNYRVRIAPDGLDSDGEWFGLWITDIDSNETVWIGSLKFPLLNGRARIEPRSYTTTEVYGKVFRPIDIPEWYVSVERPLADGVPSSKGHAIYPQDVLYGDALNSDVRYDPIDGRIHFRLGGTTERKTPPERIDFE